MASRKQHPAELRERAVAMVFGPVFDILFLACRLTSRHLSLFRAV
jgi:hypothetical protein